MNRRILAIVWLLAGYLWLPASVLSQEVVPPRRAPASGVLGRVALTGPDSVAAHLVSRLSFQSYKDLIRGLADFGDRQARTQGNALAVEWIEGQLRGWGYETERHTFVGGQEQVFATKIGGTAPGEMYIIGAHMDGRGGGQAVNDNASGTALVLEIARVLASSDVETATSIRFILWNAEETGALGASSYVAERARLQGMETPVGSGMYPEPRWLGMIQHDMLLFDHGNPVQTQQAGNADIDIEFQLNSEKWPDSAQLALVLLNANRKFATDYPATLSNSMANTDSEVFQNLTAAVSVRENRRLYEIGQGSNPHWHRASDVFETFTDADFRLGYNAAQTTLSAIVQLAGVRVLGQ